MSVKMTLKTLVLPGLKKTKSSVNKRAGKKENSIDRVVIYIKVCWCFFNTSSFLELFSV